MTRRDDLKISSNSWLLRRLQEGYRRFKEEGSHPIHGGQEIMQAFARFRHASSNGIATVKNIPSLPIYKPLRVLLCPPPLTLLIIAWHCYDVYDLMEEEGGKEDI